MSYAPAPPRTAIPSGAAGGDLAGNYPNPTLGAAANAKIAGLIATTPVTITSHAVAYQFVLADQGTEVEYNAAGAAAFTIPTHATVAFPVGAVIVCRQQGAGQLTVAAAGGVTLDAPNGAKTSKQYSTLSLVQRVADEWVVSGDTTV